MNTYKSLPLVICLLATATGGLMAADPAPAAEDAIDLNAITSRKIEMHPSDKRPLTLKGAERNPYANRGPEEIEVADDAGENSEENKIRQKLTSLTVTGGSVGNNGPKLLLSGGIVLERGQVVPPLLLDQTQNLQVLTVADDSVTLGWLDIETGEQTGKTMQIAYDLSPTVRYQLAGQAKSIAENGEAVEPRMGVHRVGQERKKQAAQRAKESPANFLPEEVYKAAQ